MGVFNFYQTPLIFGNPFQTTVNTEEELLSLISMNSGKAPVFISHNSYPTWKDGEPFQVLVTKLFSDLDSKTKPENAQLDCLKLIDFCDEHELPYLSGFSGSKGFHFYIGLKSETYVFGEWLKRATKAVHLWLKKTLSLRTLDTRTCEPKRLCRVFYTPHVTTDKKTGKPLTNGFYCCPLLPEWIREWDIRQIMEYARSPTYIDYNPIIYPGWDPKLLTLSEFISHFDINVDAILDGYRELSESEFKTTHCEYYPVEDVAIKELLPRPCIHSQIVNNINPPHLIRFNACIELRDLGCDKAWVFKFFQDRNYIDRCNTSVCAYQINNIFDHQPYYKKSSCRNLYNEGFCVGKICPKYNEGL